MQKNKLNILLGDIEIEDISTGRQIRRQEKRGELKMRSILSIVAIILAILVVSIVETPCSDETNPSWDWSTTAYSTEPTNPKIVTVWWEIDQELCPATVWIVRGELDNFVLERNFDMDNFDHLYTIVRERLEKRGITGFRILGAGIEDAI